MAWICEKPTVCFIIKGNPENVDSKNQSIAWPIVKKLPFSKVIFQSEYENDFSRIRADIFEFLQEKIR